MPKPAADPVRRRGITDAHIRTVSQLGRTAIGCLQYRVAHGEALYAQLAAKATDRSLPPGPQRLHIPDHLDFYEIAPRRLRASCAVRSRPVPSCNRRCSERIGVALLSYNQAMSCRRSSDVPPYGYGHHLGSARFMRPLP